MTSLPSSQPNDQPAAAARGRLAGFWNAWFSTREIAQARALAKTASEAECQAELDRLESQRNARLEQWRWTQ